jgi:hypothetical protein
MHPFFFFFFLFLPKRTTCPVYGQENVVTEARGKAPVGSKSVHLRRWGTLVISGSSRVWEKKKENTTTYSLTAPPDTRDDPKSPIVIVPGEALSRGLHFLSINRNKAMVLSFPKKRRRIYFFLCVLGSSRVFCTKFLFWYSSIERCPTFNLLIQMSTTANIWQ